MATFEANLTRAVAIELKAKVLDLYLAVLPIQRAAAQWMVNDKDAFLPAPFDVKVALAAYQKLTVERLKLEAWVTQLLAAGPGDTLTYPLPSGTFDGSANFDGTLTFDGGTTT